MGLLQCHHVVPSESQLAELLHGHEGQRQVVQAVQTTAAAVLAPVIRDLH